DYYCSAWDSSLTGGFF
nr:immunoglobulin light chain junction region [Macaca mulatta]MOV66986.1 immunoglobulin light chain junction region [Macaca mulatta]MOV68118.1 immunoglobulin light chain junction region [Macaca mulatta]MOV68225.1 immunoglobulin light chain junction region [Macaca mulatta]MOV68782.1 immunoglobulin light chain junction region [Macaca mulatta]